MGPSPRWEVFFVLFFVRSFFLVRSFFCGEFFFGGEFFFVGSFLFGEELTDNFQMHMIRVIKFRIKDRG